MRRLAPLSALRAFEAAARHLSFSKAASELHVTPAAVSQQVKQLEAYIGTPLFRRLTRALVLTEAGQLVLPALREGFDKLATATELLMAHPAQRLITVSATPAFAARWLVPRLDQFRTFHPGLDVRIDASERLVDFDRDQIEMAIRYGRGDYPGLRVDRLFVGEQFPVCSPRLLEGPEPLREPRDLARHVLLHVDWKGQEDHWPDWHRWLLAAGVAGVDASRGPRFNHGGLALQMAIDGRGVALAEGALVADDLAAGRLVRPFGLGIPTRFGYYVVLPERLEELPAVHAFRRWLLAEAASGRSRSSGSA